MKTNQDIYKKLRVLVTDDHMLMRNMISQNLRSIGIQTVETASNGEDALKEINSAMSAGKPYHILFMDWHMPGVEGLTVLQTCRKEKRFDNTAIVMLTAEQEQRHILHAIESGATSYIVKPVSREVLEQNVEKVVKWLLKKNPDFLQDQGIAPVKKKEAAASSESQFSKDLRQDLKPVVAKGIENIFSEIFKVKIVPDEYMMSKGEKDMVCIGRLHQKDVTIALRFFFDQSLLQPLLRQLYSSEFLEDKSVYEDAACEIVNILCAQVKAFLNKQGYDLQLDLPAMGSKGNTVQQGESLLNVHFQLNEEQTFLIDISEDKGSATGGA